MQLFIPKLNKEGIGGGNTFVANFRREMEKYDKLTDSDLEGSDLMFVANPMWAEREDFEKAKSLGKPIVLRVDNIPEDWNNRGTAITKLRDFTKWADKIIFQSEWARQKYLEFGSPDGIVINNGVDTSLFDPNGVSMKCGNYPRILFVKSSRNENKRYPEGMEIFRRYYQQNKNSKLFLIGQFADDYHKYNFGFYNGENIQYLGFQGVHNMPFIYRSVDILLFPAYADAAPNVVLEAMACGVRPIIHPYGGGVDFIHDGVKELGVNLCEWEGDYKGMIEAALAISPEDVVNHVRTNHTSIQMVNNYREIFNGLVV